MVKTARSSLKDIGDKISFACSKAEDFTLTPNSVDVVTVARAFHWMDQDAVLESCKSMLKEGGAVVILNENSLWYGTANWQKTAKQTTQRFLGEKRRAGDGYYSSAEEAPFEEVLGRHGFKDIKVKEFEITRLWDFDSILGYLYSTSFASPGMFGSKLMDFEESLRRDLGNPGPDDIFEEKTNFSVTSGVNSKY